MLLKFKKFFKQRKDSNKQEEELIPHIQTEREKNVLITGKLLLDHTMLDCNQMRKEITLPEEVIHNYTNDSFKQIEDIIDIYNLVEGIVNIVSEESIYQQNQNRQYLVSTLKIPVPSL